MFEDQPTPSGVPPKNLPTGPEDMFAVVDKTAAAAPATAPAPVQPQAPANALAAGLLKRKTEAAPRSAELTAEAPLPPTGQISYALKGPVLGKIIAVIVGGLVLGIMGFGGWWLYSKYSQKQAAPPAAAPLPPPEEQAATTAPAVIIPPSVPAGAESPATSTAAKMSADKILFGEQIDSDKDGLDDVREKELGTDPDSIDTDTDGLSDGDEVLIWKTDPLNPDTDGDGYSDGTEVRNSYNPLGPGKLFNLPPGATTTLTTGTATKK